MASTLDCMNINLLLKNVKNGFFNKKAKKKCNNIKENFQRIKRGITSPTQNSSLKFPKEERLTFPIPTTMQAELENSTEKKKTLGIICRGGRTFTSFN